MRQNVRTGAACMALALVLGLAPAAFAQGDSEQAPPGAQSEDGFVEQQKEELTIGNWFENFLNSIYDFFDIVSFFSPIEESSSKGNYAMFEDAAKQIQNKGDAGFRYDLDINAQVYQFEDGTQELRVFYSQEWPGVSFGQDNFATSHGSIVDVIKSDKHGVSFVMEGIPEGASVTVTFVNGGQDYQDGTFRLRDGTSHVTEPIKIF